MRPLVLLLYTVMLIKPAWYCGSTPNTVDVCTHQPNTCTLTWEAPAHVVCCVGVPPEGEVGRGEVNLQAANMVTNSACARRTRTCVCAVLRQCAHMVWRCSRAPAVRGPTLDAPACSPSPGQVQGRSALRSTARRNLLRRMQGCALGWVSQGVGR
jgi:hypothetical protein